MTATMPAASDRADARDPRDRARLGGRRIRARRQRAVGAAAATAGIHVCKRVSEVVEAADAIVKRAELN